MNNLKKLQKKMREDWDRRVSHDYRFWMSDGFESDEHMWRSGERDFALMFSDITTDSKELHALELGCGVGRLLRPAAQAFQTVTGVDISPEAVAKAKELLKEYENITVIQGNGIDLKELATGSIDVAFSYASLTSCPTRIIAEYLIEFKRVLCNGGYVYLQLYLGDEHRVNCHDTLHLRCYEQSAFVKALEYTGFEVRSVKELKLPFEGSSEELGVKAVVLVAQSKGKQRRAAKELARILLPSGDESEEEQNLIPDLEAFLATQFAQQLAQSGDYLRAEKAVRYALAVSKANGIDTSDLLQRIVAKIEGGEPEDAEPVPDEAIDSCLEKKNQIQGDDKPLAVLQEICEGGIPSVEKKNRELLAIVPGGERALESIASFLEREHEESESRQTDEGKIILFKGQCLDHPTKPKTAAQGWAERSLNSDAAQEADTLFVYGLGGGFHLKELLDRTRARVVVIEPQPAVLAALLRNGSYHEWLGKLAGIYVGQEVEEFRAAWESDFLTAHLLIRAQSQVGSLEFCRSVKNSLYFQKSLTQLNPSIAVLGPIQGGTLPIASYSLSGLISLGQRARFVDMSPFAPGMNALDGFLQEDIKRMLVRNRMVQFLSDTLLELYDEKPFDILLCMALAPVSPKTLGELRKRGVTTVLWFMEDYLRFTYWQQFAEFYDFIFCIQKGDCIKALRQAGAGEVHYMPMACDPVIHKEVALSSDEKKRWGSPISFVGAGYHNRVQSFASLSHLPFKIWGTEWPEGRPFDKMIQEKGRRVAPDEYVRIFNASDININLHSSTEKDGVDPSGDFVNPRTFELAATNAFQLCDERSLLSELFEPGEEIITYSSIPELRDKIDYYLEHEEERAVIAKKALSRVLKEHTYAHRLRDMLAIIYSSRFSELSSRVDRQPWKRFLERAKPHSELHERCMKAFKRREDPNLDSLVSDIIVGDGDMTETEQKLMFLFHIRKYTIKKTEAND
jgi:spore maturation protein CgeB